MPMFHYEATDRNGRSVVGSMDARDEGAVRQRLAQSGYTPILIETAAGAATPPRGHGQTGNGGPSYGGPSTPPGSHGNGGAQGSAGYGAPGYGAPGYGGASGPGSYGIPAASAPGYGGAYGQGPGSSYGARGQAADQQFVPTGRRPGVNVSTRALAQFYRQMANAVKGGVPLTQALPAMANQTSDRRLREAIKGMEASVAGGRPMSEAMDQFPRVFSAGHVGLVRAGEGGGYLEKAFEELATQADTDWSLESATRFNIILFIMRWILIPWLIGYAWFMGHMGMWHTAEGGMDWHGFERDAIQSCVAMVVGAAVVNLVGPFLFKGFRGTRLGGILDSIFMSLPVFGARRKRLDRVKTLSSLSSAMNAGVPLTVAWQLSTEAADSEPFRRAMSEQSQFVRTGTPIPEVLAATRLYDQNTMQMAYSGEMAGNLPEMLSQAVYYQREEAKHIGQLTPWVIAVIVLFIVMAVMAYMVIVFGAQVYGGEVENALKQTQP